ncbi:hypothetical protein ABW20_dc0101650 [Dactylellina cionopaga]|nr:hypothetical protein ABW20_dc0101650 [Dactylellina cionopaga]
MLPAFRKSLHTAFRPRLHIVSALPRRHLSSQIPPSAPAPGPTSQASRVDRIVARFPRFLRPYTSNLLHQPGTHLTSFLILHELTAVIPLFTFVYVFHVTGWNPSDLLPKEWIDSGYDRFKRYVERKGWGEKVDGRLLMNFATSYAVVKALVPVRVLVSLWGMPWFARVAVLPVLGLFRRGPKVPVGK